MTLTNKLLVFGLLTGLAAYSMPNHTRADESAQVVKITASKFHFTPDHITLIKGQPVTFQLISTDTTHGFLIRALKIDTDIKPGKVTEMTVTPATAGTFKAICDHYCGLGHSGMKLTVVVKEAVAKTSSAKVAGASNSPPDKQQTNS
jgi:cytochrome c oxidase subunit II